MRILDIDLDFFLDNIAHGRSFNKRRLNKKYYNPWTIPEVEFFLENNCGLNKIDKIPGKYFIHHDEVFHYIKKEIINENISDSIDLVHVDAHGDISNTIDTSFIYIMDEMLTKSSIKERLEIKNKDELGQLNAGNFLIYMVACKMINELTFVKHQKTCDQFPPLFYQNNDRKSKCLQLKSYGKGFVKNAIGNYTDLHKFLQTQFPLITDNLVPFSEIFWPDFNDGSKFDLIFLTQSPSYTPITSDNLIPVINEYMVIV